jgi:hypothetical protein
LLTARWLAIALTIVFLLVGRLPSLARLAEPIDAAGKSWHNVSAPPFGGPPPSRAQHAMASDQAGHVLMFGGSDSDGEFLNDLWSYDTRTRVWTEVRARGSVKPPALLEPHIVIDTNGDVYEFGGLTELGALSAGLYRFSASDGRWTDLGASAVAARVPAREDHGWALDPDRRQIYLWGGLGGLDGAVDYMNDFWRYDIATDSWTNLTVASGATAIVPREIYNITYDNHGHLYLFGGVYPAADSYAIRSNDLWRYDIARGVWEDLSALTGSRAVPGRHYYGQACDADGNFYVLGGWFTQTNGAEIPFVGTDFWKFDAGAMAWVKVADDLSSGTGVLPRIPYVMAFNRGTNSLVIFGGSDSFELSDETFSLDLTDAIPALPTVTPARVPDGPDRKWYVPMQARGVELRS